ncbi:MAG TPA: type II toxin-antitoxin system HicB family antitoxin [Dehalococcoidia bacterium]|nr:type II toxin-antitoxin system HicB family antitoxin [Dehalococcoidia bacterium]
MPDPDGGFIAEVLELPGCVSQGETPDEAFDNLNDAMAGYIASLLDRGYSIPEPVGVKEYSGRFLLRISSELHRSAAMRAMREGVSLNQWIAQAISERLAAKNLADDVAVRVADQVVARFRNEVLSGRVRPAVRVRRQRGVGLAGAAPQV